MALKSFGSCTLNDNWFEERAPPLNGVIADYGVSFCRRRRCRRHHHHHHPRHWHCHRHGHCERRDSDQLLICPWSLAHAEAIAFGAAMYLRGK